MKALPGFICASNLAFKRRLVVQMRQGMMGMSFEDTFDQVVCSKSGNLLQKESVASVGVKKVLPATQCHFKKQWLCLLQRLVAVPSIVGDDED